jgi:hypothetical protein
LYRKDRITTASMYIREKLQVLLVCQLHRANNEHKPDKQSPARSPLLAKTSGLAD